MIPLNIRQFASRMEAEHPEWSIHEAVIKGYLFAKEEDIPFVDDAIVKPEPEVVTMATDDDMFEYAWKLYDRKDNKKSAIKAWKKLSPKDKQKVLSVIPDYVKAHDEKKYRPMFATFLNQERYNDEDIDINEYGRQSAEQQERAFVENSLRSIIQSNK